MNDWQHALAGSPWLAHTTKSVELGTPHPWDRQPVPSLPQLSHLLQTARVTPLVLNGAPHELLAWDLSDGTTTGWLCAEPSPPPAAPPAPPIGTPALPVPEVLHDLWRATGGVVDYWNDLENWMSSHNGALTVELADTVAAELVADAAWVWEQDGLTLPFDPAEYGVLAEEAGGILTLFHRVSGEVLMFAQDHNFDHLEVLDGCLEYTFYRIPAAPDVAAWVETVAGQWLTAVRR
ncbi:hypothetical protein [Kribbella endophytica]